MRTYLKRRPPRLRLPLPVLLLSLAIGVASVLAFQAFQAERENRQTGERALGHYATVAAWELARHAGHQASHAVAMALAPATHLRLPGAGGPLPPPSILADAEASRPACDCPVVQGARFHFRVDLRSGALHTDGEWPAGATRAWLADTVAAAARAAGEVRGHPLIAHVSGGEPLLVAYTVVRDELGPRAAYGFVADAAVFAAPFRNVMRNTALLPPALTRAAPNDTLLAVVVSLPDGAEIYASPAAPATRHAAMDTLGSALGGMRVRVRLRPAAADALLVHGTRGSRTPLLLGLLFLTGALFAMALLQLRREAQLVRLRSDFVANVSHELRTPLAQIRMFTETLRLRRERSEQERAVFLDIVDCEAKRLSHLVDNVLHFARAERGSNRLDLETVRVVAEVRDALRAFAPLAAANGVELRIEPAGDPCAVLDRDALRQILLNLLDNAVKYGPEGQTVTVGVAASRGCVRFWVDDEGPGIAATDRQRIFSRFTRLESVAGSAATGTGIGLAVVRELAESQGGRVWAEGAPGAGARLVVELPRAEPPTPVQEGDPSCGPAQRGSRTRVRA